MSLINRFFAWIGSLMRRRHFISTLTVIAPPSPPPPPPPPPPGTAGQPIGLLILLTKAA